MPSKEASIRTRFLHKVAPVSYTWSPSINMSGPETWITHSPIMMYQAQKRLPLKPASLACPILLLSAFLWACGKLSNEFIHIKAETTSKWNNYFFETQMPSQTQFTTGLTQMQDHSFHYHWHLLPTWSAQKTSVQDTQNLKDETFSEHSFESDNKSTVKGVDHTAAFLSSCSSY